MGKLDFYRKCFKIALESKWGRSSALVVITLSLVAYFVAPLEGAMNILLWAIPLVIFVATLIIAPYHLYKDKEKEQNELSRRLHDIENACPNITLVRTENVLGNVWTGGPGRLSSVEHPWFIRVQIANDPKSPLQAVNAVIAAHITFYDSTGTRCFPSMVGRWAETPEIAQGGQPIEIEQLTIPPTARPYILDIGLKYHDEDKFYAYNNETPRKSTVGFRDKDRQLKPGTYSVEVKLKGYGVDKAFWFELINLGKGKEVHFNIRQPEHIA